MQAARLNAGIYSGQRVFLIVNKTKTIRRMVESGLKVKEVNIGNMGEKEGRQRIQKIRILHIGGTGGR